MVWPACGTGGSGAPPTQFIFRPGAVPPFPQSNIYNDFTALTAAASVVAGEREVIFDFSLGAAPIPIGNHEFNRILGRVSFVGIIDGAYGGAPQITYQDGASVQGVTRFKDVRLSPNFSLGGTRVFQLTGDVLLEFEGLGDFLPAGGNANLFDLSLGNVKVWFKDVWRVMNAVAQPSMFGIQKPAVGPGTLIEVNVLDAAFFGSNNFADLPGPGAGSTVAATIVDHGATFSATQAAVATVTVNPIDSLKIVEVILTLAQLQAAGAVNNFTFPLTTLPANARLIGAETNVVTTLTAGALVGALSFVGGVTPDDIQDATLVGGGVAVPGLFNVPGTNPYMSRGGETLSANIRLNGNTFDNLDTGEVAYRFLYTVEPI